MGIWVYGCTDNIDVLCGNRNGKLKWKMKMEINKKCVKNV
jgi:hypothetical protein